MIARTNHPDLVAFGALHPGEDRPGTLEAIFRLNRDKIAHLPAYLERNMVAPRHWNPPGA